MSKKHNLSRRDFLRLAGLSSAALATGSFAPGLMSSVQGQGVSGTVEYWHSFIAEFVFAGVEEVLAKFAEDYPDINIEPLTVPNSDFVTKFTTAVLGGAAPDTTLALSSRIADLVAIEGIQDISDRVEADGLKDLIPEERWRLSTIDGGIYGIPSFMFVDLMYYRADWFEEAGVEPPTTWEEFTQAAIALTDPEQGRFGFGLRGGGGGQGNLLPVIEGFNGPIVDDDLNPTLDVDAAAAALEWYTELFTAHGAVPPSVVEDSFRQMIEGFQIGQTAMIWHHTGSLGEMQAVLGNEGTFLTAQRPMGPVQLMGASTPGFNALASPDPENEEASWAWLKYWTEIDTQILFLEKTGYFPSTTAAAEDTRVLENPLYSPLVDTVNIAASPGFPGGNGWAGNTVLPTLQQTLLGDVTPQQAAQTIVDELEVVLEEAGA